MKIKKFIFPLLLASISTSLFAKDNIDSSMQTRLDSLSKLQRVLSTVEQYYVDDLKFEEIVNKSLKGLMQELDAHSSFMDEKYFKEMQISTKGEFGGLGITVGLRDGALTIISPIDDTPAFKAGVKAGDIILKIDDKSTINMTLDEAVGFMRGKPKTPIEITVVREDEIKPIKIKIIRDIIKIQSVYVKTIGDDILYLRVASFDQKVTKGLIKAIEENKSFKGIILDLRNNPGGLLTQAINVTDLFIDDGIIVSQKGRDIRDEESFSASSSKTKTDKPLIVLINGGSASASEIVSGALQDHKRAILVGRKTFGKGSVQVILPIHNRKSLKKEGIKLTIAKYYLPSGRTIQATGVTPDIISYPGKAVSKPTDEFKIKEVELKKHLENELVKVDGKDENRTKYLNTEDISDNKKIITEEQINKDNQLKTGVDILKALILLKG